jgi:hypothetical protein
LVRASVALLIAGISALLVAPAAAAAPAGIAVAITDGMSKVHAGQRLTYAVTVSNAGSAVPLTGTLVVAVSKIAAVTTVGGGTPAGNTVSYAIDLQPGKESVVKLGVQLPTRLDGGQSLSANAALTLTGESTAAVAAVDSDGVVASPAQASSSDGGPDALTWALIGGTAVLIALLIVLAVRILRCRPRPAAR